MTDPTPYTYVCDTRDAAVVRFPLATNPDRCAWQPGIIFDADRDLRMLCVLTAMRYRSPRTCHYICAVHETRGHVTVWCSAPTEMQRIECMRSLQNAADTALLPFDAWKIDSPPRIVGAPNGILDRALLLVPDDPPLLAMIPERFQLGRVRL